MTKKFYTCRYDRAFKEVFMNEKNKDLLIVLLEKVLNVKIDSIEYLNLEDIVDNIEVRKKLYDLRLNTNIGRIQVEVNSNIYNYSKNRQMAYLCNEYSHITLSGEEYNEEIDIIQINFTYGMMKNFEEKNKNLFDDRGMRIYKLMDNESKLYVNNFKIYEINMDYYMKFWYNEDKENIEKYKYFIMMDLDKNDLEKLSKSDWVVNKYMNVMEKLNKLPKYIEFISAEEDERKMRNTIKRIAREEGLEEGREEGEKNRNLEIAKKMKEDNVDILVISKYTGLSNEEIKNI